MKKYGAVLLFVGGLIVIGIVVFAGFQYQKAHPQTEFDSDVIVEDGGIRRPE
jgi:hypothetical protein